MAYPAFRSKVETGVSAASNAVSVAAPTGVVSGDYQLVIVSISSGSVTFPATPPTGWAKVSDDEVSSSTSPDRGGTHRIGLYESTTATGAFTMTLAGTARIWAAVRLAYSMPAGAAGRAVAVVKTIEATGVSTTSKALPSVTAGAVDSLAIGVGVADFPSSNPWTGTGTYTQRSLYAGGATAEAQSFAVGDKQTAASTASTGTFTLTTGDETALYQVVVGGTLVAKSGAALATLRLQATRTGTQTRASSATAAVILAGATEGSPARDGIPDGGILQLVGTADAGKAGGDSATATLLLAASATGNKVNVGLAVMLLAAEVTDTLHEAATPDTASMLLSATGGNTSRDTPALPVAAVLLLGVSTTGTSDRAEAVSSTALYLSAEANALRVVVEISAELRAKPPSTVPYELVCVARIPQSSGPPLLIEVDPIDWTGLSFTDELSKAPVLQAGCQISNLTEPVLQRLRNPSELATELWLYRAGKLVFAGPLLAAQAQNEGVTLRAVGLLGYLRWMVVDVDKVFSQVDQFAIATSLIDQWQVLPYGNFGIDTSDIAPSGIVRDATYLAKELHNVGQRVEELGARQSGFDVSVDPTARKLQLDFPQRGVDRSAGEDAIVFDARNITSSDIVISCAPGDVASEGYGTGTGGDPLSSTQFNEDLRATFGRTAITGSWNDVSEQPTLDAHVQGLLDARGAALVVPGPNVRVTPDADLASYDVGDTVSYQVHGLLSIEGAYRLRKRQVTVSKTGQESVSLEFV